MTQFLKKVEKPLFWAILGQTRFLPKKKFRQKIPTINTLRFRAFLAKTNDSILRKSRKSRFLDHF